MTFLPKVTYPLTRELNKELSNCTRVQNQRVSCLKCLVIILKMQLLLAQIIFSNPPFLIIYSDSKSTSSKYSLLKTLYEETALGHFLLLNRKYTIIKITIAPITPDSINKYFKLTSKLVRGVRFTYMFIIHFFKASFEYFSFQ